MDGKNVLFNLIHLLLKGFNLESGRKENLFSYNPLSFNYIS